jgi:hypothetical protein
MDACQQEQDIACGGCSIATLKEIQKFDRVGVKQCSLEFSAGGEIVTVTSCRKLGGSSPSSSVSVRCSGWKPLVL